MHRNDEIRKLSFAKKTKSLHKNCPPHATESMSTIPNVFPDHVLFFLYESNCQASLAGSWMFTKFFFFL